MIVKHQTWRGFVSSSNCHRHSRYNSDCCREGDNVSLACDATGYPPPHIVWRREDGDDILVAGGKKTNIVEVRQQQQQQ